LSAPSADAATASDCDREPIHIPGGIQPYGALLVVAESSLTVTQASENLVDHTTVRADEVLGQPLSTLFDDDSLRALRDTLAHARPEELNPLPLTVRGRRFDGIVHRNDGVTLVELEPLPSNAPAYSPHHALRPALLRVQSADSLLDLYRQLLGAIRELTGFERAMIYRFDERGHGSVDAESKEPELESYVGLHYPASDIPRQARALYMKQWLRIIPDAGYVPARLEPLLRPDTGAPLDLTCAALRSVSPIHREYLANMGVRASMSVSLVVRGRLWGLISCTNHSGPRHVRYELRSACEVLARLASLEIAAIEDRQAAAARNARRGFESALAARMRNSAPDENLLEGLLGEPARLLELVNASGAAVVSGKACATCGRAPLPQRVLELAAWLDHEHGQALYATESLATEWPDARDIKDSASGVLTFALPGETARRVLWFRGEVLGTVAWGGNPNKAVELGADERPHPRRSFALWVEEVRLHAAPWTSSDTEAADELRRYALETDLERQVARGQRAVRARDEVLAVVAHDLRNPLWVIDLQARELLQTDAASSELPSLREGAAMTRSAVAQMTSLIDNLLDLAAIEAGRLPLHLQPVAVQETVEQALQTLRPLAEANGLTLVAELDSGASMLADRDRFYQVLSNLIGNAVKFTPAGGRITLRAEPRGGEVIFTVADTGPGIPPEELKDIFVRYSRTDRAEQRKGVGLGLFVVKGIVEMHGGQIRAVSAPGEGATFVFSLPRA
jgi:light-regulated signal transduction histidine kinase (bacteriophytochrome)